jgi:broad specificity phosphatase PhoE
MSGPPPAVLLTRHGTSEHNLETRFYMGRSPESRLVPEGREQARALGTYLAETHPVARIVASSLPRARETADLVAARLGGVPVDADDAFWELSKGDWEGRMPREGVPDAERTRWERHPFDFRFPGGESFSDVAARVVPAFDRWLARCSGEPLLFVLHGDVICALLRHLLALPPEGVRALLVRPCSLTELVPEAGAWRMLRFSDDGFLPAALRRDTPAGAG